MKTRTLDEWLKEKPPANRKNPFTKNPLTKNRIIRLINIAIILTKARKGDRVLEISKKSKIPYSYSKNLVAYLEEKEIIKMENTTKGKEITWISKVHQEKAKKTLENLYKKFQELDDFLNI